MIFVQIIRPLSVRIGWNSELSGDASAFTSCLRFTCDTSQLFAGKRCVAPPPTSDCCCCLAQTSFHCPSARRRRRPSLPLDEGRSFTRSPSPVPFNIPSPPHHSADTAARARSDVVSRHVTMNVVLSMWKKLHFVWKTEKLLCFFFLLHYFRPARLPMLFIFFTFSVHYNINPSALETHARRIGSPPSLLLLLRHSES